VVIPLPANVSLPGVNAAKLLTVTGDFVQTAGANLNGIVAKTRARRGAVQHREALPCRPRLPGRPTRSTLAARY
jgi:hypothetical protein